MLTLEELEDFLKLGHETRSFEVKGPGPLDTAHTAKVARAAMAMGNLRDGGYVCIGIDNNTVADMARGLDDGQFAAWSDYDNVSDALAKYCDPPVTFELQPFELTNGSRVVVLEVAEFEHIPHVCKKDYERDLQKGFTYVRPRGKPQSVAVPSAVEMRELLDIAIDKGVREFIRRAQVSGVMLGTLQTPEDVDRDAYRTEATVAWDKPSTVLLDILDAAHLDVSVRPTTYEEGRLAPPELEQFIYNNTVRLRGWPVPYTRNDDGVRRLPGSIGQDIEPRTVPHMEAWRMCTSGQFLHRRVLVSDLRDLQEAQPTSPNTAGVVVVWDVLLYLVEVAEFGARLATSLDLPSVSFDVTIAGIEGRELVSGDWNRELHGLYYAPANVLVANLDAATPRLLAQPRVVGVELSQQLFQQFGLAVPDQVLFDWQAEVFRDR